MTHDELAGLWIKRFWLELVNLTTVALLPRNFTLTLPLSPRKVNDYHRIVKET